MANDFGHELMTREALNSLPTGALGFLSEEKENIEKIYCLDAFHHVEESQRFMTMPNGKTPFFPWDLRKTIIPEPGMGKDYFSCEYYDHTALVFEHYIAEISTAIKEERRKDAARYIGILAHFIEDCGTPPHAMGSDYGLDLEIVKLLLPPPSHELRLAPLHSMLENQYEDFSLNNYKPSLMGLTASEAAFNMMARFTDMLENSIQQILPMTQAFYDGKLEKMAFYLTQSASFSSKVLADALNTAYRIAMENFNEDEISLLSSSDLSEAVPVERTAWAPYPYYFPVVRNSNMSLGENFKPFPLQLREGDEIKTYHKGFGVGSPFKIIFQIPVSVYKYFSAQIGLHPKLGLGGSVIFKVFIDEKEVYNSGVVSFPDMRDVKIELNNARRLTLAVDSPEETPKAFNNQAVWAYPLLMKIGDSS